MQELKYARNLVSITDLVEAITKPRFKDKKDHGQRNGWKQYGIITLTVTYNR
jgi:hypothetical protein